MDSKSGPAPSSQQRAYDFLKGEISSFRYRPHHRLKALDIADELGVSRTPVKEALSRLEQEGLVRRELGSGYVVEAITARQILGLYQVREALEVEAAREALPHIGAPLFAKLARSLDSMKKLVKEK